MSRDLHVHIEERQYAFLRGEADLLADLAHRGRVAVRVHVLDEVVPDLLLAGGEQGGKPPGVAEVDERVFAISVETPSDDVKPPERTAGPPLDAPALCRAFPWRDCRV